MSIPKKYKVVIADPSETVLSGLKEIIGRTDRLAVVEATDDYHSMRDRFPVLAPDILILNPSMVPFSPYGSFRDNGVMKDCPVVSILYHHLPANLLKGFDETVSIYDPSHTIVTKLLSVLERTAEPVQNSEDHYELTDREKEILVSVARGMMNKEIADQHHISIHTVISHRKNISRKTGIKTVSGLTIYAILNGLVDMKDIE